MVTPEEDVPGQASYEDVSLLVSSKEGASREASMMVSSKEGVYGQASTMATSKEDVPGQALYEDVPGETSYENVPGEASAELTLASSMEDGQLDGGRGRGGVDACQL